MSALINAIAAWGEPLPDWIEALTQACDRRSQNAVAKQIGYSGALVSQVINNRYGGGLTAVEQAVRGAFMSATVNCPIVGDLPADICNTHQRASWAPHNPTRIAFYKGCRDGCPHSRIEGGKDAQ
jgi:hypothetical protein